MKKNRTLTESRRTVINSLDEIPSTFVSEDAEREYWETHEFSKALLDSLPMTRGPLDATKTKRAPRIEIHSWDEVPDFQSEDRERDWWQNRYPSQDLLEALPDRMIMPTRLETLRGFIALARKKQAKRKVS